MKEKKADNKLCILFIGFLAVFFVISILKADSGFSEFENRYLSRKPELSAGGIFNGSFMEQFEDYVTDQFPFRNQWITFKTLSERVMLKTEINGVYFAKDEYYIEKQEKEELFSEQSEKNQQMLIDFSEKYEQILGTEHVTVMLAPTASAILREKLPLFAPEDSQGDLLAALGEKISQEVWIDMYGILDKHRDEQIYYRTDHHWTTLGAFYGYCGWKEKRGEAVPKRSDYEEICLTDSFTGTLYAKVNVPMKPDSIYAFIRPGEVLRMRLDMDGEWKDSLYSYDRLTTRDKYAVFCDGNHAMTEIETCLDNNRHLLVIKDSYAHCLVPFFTADFSRITMLDLRYYNGSIEDYVKNSEVTDVMLVYNLAGFVSDRYINKLIN